MYRQLEELCSVLAVKIVKRNARLMHSRCHLHFVSKLGSFMSNEYRMRQLSHFVQKKNVLVRNAATIECILSLCNGQWE